MALCDRLYDAPGEAIPHLYRWLTVHLEFLCAHELVSRQRDWEWTVEGKRKYRDRRLGDGDMAEPRAVILIEEVKPYRPEAYYMGNVPVDVELEGAALLALSR